MSADAKTDYKGQELGLTLKQARIAVLAASLIRLGVPQTEDATDRQKSLHLRRLEALGWAGPALTASRIRGAAPAVREAAGSYMVPNPTGLEAIALDAAARKVLRDLDGALALLAPAEPAAEPAAEPVVEAAAPSAE